MASGLYAGIIGNELVYKRYQDGQNTSNQW